VTKRSKSPAPSDREVGRRLLERAFATARHTARRRTSLGVGLPTLHEVTEELEGLAVQEWGAAKRGPGDAPWQKGLVRAGLGTALAVREALRPLGWSG